MKTSDFQSVSWSKHLHLLKWAGRIVGVSKSLVSSCRYSITEACVGVVNQIPLQILLLLGSSMEDKTGRENCIAAADKENTVSYFTL